MGNGASFKQHNYEKEQSEEKLTVFSAARSGDLELLRSFTNTEFSSRDAEDCTPLFYAAQNGHADVCEFLIKEKRVELQQEAFFEAIKESHLAVCKQFVEHNISLEGALRVALENDAVQMCKYLLFVDAPIREEDELGDRLSIETMIKDTGRADIIKKFRENLEKQSKEVAEDNSVRPFDDDLSPVGYSVRPVSRASLIDEIEVNAGKILDHRQRAKIAAETRSKADAENSI